MFVHLSMGYVTMTACNLLHYAHGLHDAASCPIDHIVLHTMTELDVGCIHQVTVFVEIDITLLHCRRLAYI